MIFVNRSIWQLSLPKKYFLNYSLIRPKSLIPLGTNVRSMVTSANEQEKENAKPISEMPGLKSVPLLGSLPFMMTYKDFTPSRMHLFWRALAKKYGKILKLHIPTIPPFVVLTDPADIKVMYELTKNDPVRHGFYSLSKVRRETADNFFENKTGLLGENNEEWYRVRSRIQAPMMKTTNILKFLPEIDNVTMDFVERIAVFQSKYGEMPENFLNEIYKWAFECISVIALNRRMGCLHPNLSPDSDPMRLINNANAIFESMNYLEMSWPIWKWIPTKQYRRLKHAHDNFLNLVMKNVKVAEEELEQKIRSGVTSEDFTLLEVFLKTEGLTRKDTLTLILDFFFAGNDTTSHSIAFTLYCLAKNPKAQQSLHNELDEVLGDGKQTLTNKHVGNLSFLKTCVKESMRMFPPVFAAVRTLQEDSVIGGYLVPKGHQLLSLQMATTQDENNFRRANEFLPERWRRDKPLGPIHPFAHLPFSHGIRMCVGRRISEQQTFVFLARVMHRYKIDYKYEDIDIVHKLVSCPSQPLRFQFTERK